MTTRIVNLSLLGGQVPGKFKVGVVKPLFKKRGADHENFSNFWPVSNLSFLSEVTEKAVAAQLCHHLNGRELKNFNQRICYHSKETALVRIQNDILKAVDDNKPVILLLLDLSVAFDNVDRIILVSRLANRSGMRGTALNCFRLYLQLSKQFVSVRALISH